APGITLDEARARLDAVSARLADRYPATNAKATIVADRLEDVVVAKVRQRLLLLQGAVAFVLLIPCANLAHLQLPHPSSRALAHASSRAREVAIRAARGAGRARIVRQFLAQSLLVAGAGGALGLLVASWLLGLLLAAAPDKIASLADVRLDARALAFTIAVSLAVGVLAGLVPALYVAATDPSETLKKGAGASAPGFGRDWTRRALLVSE